MIIKEREALTRQLVEAGDKLVFATKKWKADPTPENQAALLAARLDYLESEADMQVFLRERLDTKVKAQEDRLQSLDARLSELERKATLSKRVGTKSSGKK